MTTVLVLFTTKDTKDFLESFVVSPFPAKISGARNRRVGWTPRPNPQTAPSSPAGAWSRLRSSTAAEKRAAGA
jgi:hypothetical protein